MKRPQKHILHKDILWRKMLDEGRVKSLSKVAQKEGMTRARGTQIMNLLKLPSGSSKSLRMKRIKIGLVFTPAHSMLHIE